MLHGRILKESNMLQGEYHLKSHQGAVAHHSPLSSKQHLCSTMSARHAALPKKRKARHLYDGSDGVSYGRPVGITSVHIATPFIHPLDLVANPEALRTKRPRFTKIRCSQFSAYEEEAKRDAAA